MNILFGHISLGRCRFVIITVFGNVIVGEGCVRFAPAAADDEHSPR